MASSSGRSTAEGARSSFDAEVNGEIVFGLNKSSLGEATEGVWIGVDLGTSNCAAAVWDSRGGRSKWMRLGRNDLAKKERSKAGRIAPSVLLFGEEGETVDELVGSDSGLSVQVGQAAVNALDRSLDVVRTDPVQYSQEDMALAMVSSVKRIFGMSLRELGKDPDFVESLPFSLIDRHDGGGGDDVGPAVRILPVGSEEAVAITPLQATVILLRSIRLSAQAYLQKEATKKGLQVPGGPSCEVRNCVVGVPAHFSQSQRHLMTEACRMAGFDGRTSTFTESTAAILSYGLFVSHPPNTTKSILVFDCGAGTTDCSIAVMSSPETAASKDNGSDRQFRVVITEGDGHLGGDDMDEALLQLVSGKLGLPPSLDARQHPTLLRSCRHAKERLCGEYDGDPPAKLCMIEFGSKRVFVSSHEFNLAIRPFTKRAKSLVERAIERFEREECRKPKGYKSQHPSIDDVVLVGGATRVPAIREMLQSLFPQQLCVSVNPDSACAQGLAIQAAIRSNLVPTHKIRSALMLDALPHSIGVKTGEDEFVSILTKDTTLPARGYASFTLADPNQRGVTILAVEDVGDGLPLEPMGEFTFLLHKLSSKELDQQPQARRTVDVGFAMETDGKFIVSIFDANDPDHVRKRRRYQQRKAKEGGVELGFQETPVEGNTMEHVALVAACALLFVLYVAAKLAFNEPQEGSTII